MASLVPSPKMQFFDANGNPLVGGLLYTYAAGTTTPLATYTDSGAGTPNANPVVLDSRGEASVWCSSAEYKFVLKSAVGATIWSADNVNGADGATLAALAASSGSSLVGFIQSGTGAVATTVQAELRYTVRPEQFTGADDYAKLTSAAAKIAALGCGTLWLANTYTLTAGQILDVSACSNMIVDGPGKIIGPSITSQGLPTAYIKLQGELSTTVSFGSTITAGTTSFTVSNTFAADDMLVLSNFPTDATDAYTEGPADWLGEKPRYYANTSASNLRQTRRRELCIVRSSNGSAFELLAGTQNAYPSTSSLQFQKVIPTKNVIFRVWLENIWLLVDYARDVKINSRVTSSAIEVRSTHGIKVELQADQKDTGCLVDLHNSTTQFDIDVISIGGNIGTDNGAVRIDQVGTGKIKVVASGTKGSMYAFLADTNYSENPLGYTDVPNGPCVIDVSASRCATPSVFATCDPYSAAITDMALTVSSDTITNDAVYLKGVNGAMVDVAAKDARLRFDGVQNVTCRGPFSSIYESTFVDPRGAGTQSNSNLNLSYKSTCTLTLSTDATQPTTPCTCTAAFARDGGMVHISGYFNGVNTTGATGNMLITGIPVPVMSGFRSVGSIAMQNLGATAAVPMGIDSTVYLIDQTTGAQIPVVTGGGRYLQFSMTYPIA